MMVEAFSSIWQRACDRKGGEQALTSLLGSPRSEQELLQYRNADWLAAFSKKVFQSGFVWRVVEQKWPGFEQVFFQFEPEKILLMSAEMLAVKANDPNIIRNATKVQSIYDNARMIYELEQEHGSFTELIARWPVSDIIGLWALLKKRGARLGGNTGAYALRAMGKDTFILSQDTEAYLRAYKVIEGGLTSQTSLRQIQQQFNQWQQQSGRSMQHISRVVALSVGDNHVGMAQN